MDSFLIIQSRECFSYVDRIILELFTLIIHVKIPNQTSKTSSFSSWYFCIAPFEPSPSWGLLQVPNIRSALFVYGYIFLLYTEFICAISWRKRVVNHHYPGLPWGRSVQYQLCTFAGFQFPYWCINL